MSTTEQKPKRTTFAENELKRAKTAPEKKVMKPTLPPEQQVLIVGTMNDEVFKTIVASAKRKGVPNVVRLENEIVVDTFKLREHPEYDDKAEALKVSHHVADVNGREHAKIQARRVWDILTGGTIPIDEHPNHKFTAHQVNKAITLSQKQTKGLLDALAVMGLIIWDGTRKYGGAFTFCFDGPTMVQHLKEAVMQQARLLSGVAARYTGVATAELDKEERTIALTELSRIIDEHVVI